MLLCMHRIRQFEEAAGQALKDGHVRGSVHQYSGEEAIATGICHHLLAQDFVSSYHRGHGHAIAKGVSPARMMCELFGRSGGTSGGKGGSMHIADFSQGMLGANGVVPDGVTIAVGAAHAIKMQKRPEIVVAFFGDGAMNRGPLFEAFNWAQLNASNKGPRFIAPSPKNATTISGRFCILMACAAPTAIVTPSGTTPLAPNMP